MLGIKTFLFGAFQTCRRWSLVKLFIITLPPDNVVAFSLRHTIKVTQTVNLLLTDNQTMAAASSPYGFSVPLSKSARRPIAGPQSATKLISKGRECGERRHESLPTEESPPIESSYAFRSRKTRAQLPALNTQTGGIDRDKVVISHTFVC